MTTSRWIPLITVALGTFMLLVDVTIVNVALPDMVADLHASFTGLQWVVDVYALVLAALLLGAGGLADRLGHRTVFVAGVGLFGLASLACGVAPSEAALIAARGVQGVGAAAMFATVAPLLTHSYEGRDRGVAFGVWGAVSGIAAAVGPLLGGVLTEGLSWRWIFFVNLPVCIVTLVVAVRALPAARQAVRGRLDLGGVATFTVAAAALTAACVRVSDVGWGATSTVVLLLVALAGLVAFAIQETAAADPLLDLRLLRNGAFAGTLVAGALLSLAAFATLTFTSLWLQQTLALSPIEGGLALLPLPVASFLVAATASHRVHGARAPLAIAGGLVLVGAGDLLQLGLSASSGWSAVALGLAVTGAGAGLALPPLSAAALEAVAHERAGMAAGALNTARQLGLALGIALLGSVFSGRVAAHGAGAALGTTFGVAGAAGVVAGVVVLVLMRSRARVAVAA